MRCKEERTSHKSSERGENVAEVDCVVSVPIEIGAGRQTWRCDAVSHCAVSQDRQVEAVTVKRYKLGVQLCDLINERLNKFFFGSVANVRCAKGVNCPMIVFAVSDKCADAHDGVVDVFWEFVAHYLADFGVSLAGQIIRGCEPLKVRDRLDVPNYDVAVHDFKNLHSIAAYGSGAGRFSVNSDENAIRISHRQHIAKANFQLCPSF